LKEGLNLKNEGVRWLRERLDEIRSLRGYVSGEAMRRTAEKLGVKPPEIVKLNSNENFFMPKEKLAQLLMEVVEESDPRIYPQQEENEVKNALSKYLGVPPECVVIGSGSDPLIDLVTRLFLGRGDEALSIEPTFSLYQHLVSLWGAKYVGVPLKNDFSLDAKRILAAVSPKTKMLFVCSPNNPTANQFKMDEIQALVEEFPGVVAVDEAYVEFADYSIVRLVEKLENLIVFRTFSKAFGLAGLRLGYAVANQNLATTLSEKAQLPYVANSIALKMGLKLLANVEIVKENVGQLKRERGRLIRELNEISGVKAFNSQTNFVLFRTEKNSDEVFEALLKRGILIRNIGKILNIGGCLRTTVGLPEMNDKLLAALEQVCGE
jgi:histidinol-phosphate aminotransferase